MIRLILADLLANARIWLGALVVSAATAAVGAVVATDISTAIAVGGNAALALYGISGLIITFTTVTALIVTGSVASLTVSLQQRAYALWQLIGVLPGLVRLVVTVQLALVALLGGVLGCLAATPVLGPLYRYAFAGSPDLSTLTPRFGPGTAATTVLAVVLIVTLGGARGAGRASRTPPIESLRESELPARRMTVGRWIGGALLAAIVASMVASLPGRTPDRIVVPLMLIGPLLAGVLAALGPLYLARLLRRTPSSGSGAWFLARASTAYHVSRSTATISPVMVAVSLAGGLYAATGTVGSGPGLGSVVLLLGGPLLLSVLGATATVFMSSRRRDREYALVIAAGGTPGTVLAAAAWEAVVYVLTAVLLGSLPVLAVALIGAWATGFTPSFGLGAVGAVGGLSLLLTLAATLIPTAVALRDDVPQTIGASPSAD